MEANGTIILKLNILQLPLYKSNYNTKNYSIKINRMFILRRIKEFLVQCVNKNIYHLMESRK